MAFATQVIWNSKHTYNTAALQSVVLYRMCDYENQGYSETLQIIEKQRTSKCKHLNFSHVILFKLIFSY